MKKIITMLVCLLALSFPSYAASTGSVGVGIDVTPSNAEPQIWMNTNDREMFDPFGNTLTRQNNYAFEGEQLAWDVLVRDLNGIEDVSSVDTTLGSEAGTGNPKQAGCTIKSTQPSNGATFGWASGVEFDSNTDRMYRCIFTVEPVSSMSGEYYAQAEVVDSNDAADTFKENEFFFFNPIVGLVIENAANGLIFTEDGKPQGQVTPGETGYSQTLKVSSDVSEGSGVIMDMYIKGTDFFDSSPSAAKCPVSNVLELENFRYYATKGSYDTSGSSSADSEGYESIDKDFEKVIRGSGSQASRIAEGGDIAMTFKLNMPNPCSGNFDSGSFYFQGEAI